MFNKIMMTIKGAITATLIPLTMKMRVITDKGFREGKILSVIRRLLSKRISIKPRHKNDYYQAFGWMISKRLVLAIAMISVFLSVYYLVFVNPIIKTDPDFVMTYAYKSIPLKFINNNVKIKAKSGYVAYEGTVAGGFCNGEGTLYDKNGNVVYEGTFLLNKYNGVGKLYYRTGAVKYDGTFVNNLYEGVGNLYRMNGSVEYKGSFVNGLKEGNGTLCDAGSNEIFTGNFRADHILYEDFLGKSTAEVAEIYKGDKVVYQDDKHFVVNLPQINALYTAAANDNSLEEQNMIEMVFVLDSTFLYNGETFESIQELNQAVPDMNFEGNSYLLMPEAVVIDELRKIKETSFEETGLIYDSLYDDVKSVKDYDKDYVIYLYSFKDDSTFYTFYCSDNSGKFDFYSIERVQ